MAGRGRPKAPLVLSGVERESLQRWARRAKSSQALALRCRIVLGCAEEGGLRANQEVAAQLGVWPQTVAKWRKRFLDRRLEGLADEPRRVRRGRGHGSLCRRYVDTITVTDHRHLVLPPDRGNGKGNHGCDPNMWWDAPSTLATCHDVMADEEMTNDYLRSA